MPVIARLVAADEDTVRKVIHLGQSEAHLGPLRSFVLANSDHPSHVMLTRALHGYLRWFNAHVRHPDVLAAERRERARVRSQRQRRWVRHRTTPPEPTGEGLW